jgi:hypothetical protein
MERVSSLEEAAEFVDEVGIAAVWGKADLVLPSLWDVVGGPGADWAIRDEQGKPTGFTREFDRLWRWKDELPERQLSCAGRHFGSAALLIAPRLLAAAYALTGRSGKPEDFRAEELSPLEREVAEATLDTGPVSGPELRELLGTEDKKGVDKAITVLQRRLVLTNAGVFRQDQGWPAIQHDVFARRWRAHVRRLPSPDEAKRILARAVLAATDDLSAADLAGALGWRRKEAAAVLAELAEAGEAAVREEDGIELWSVRKRRR